MERGDVEALEAALAEDVVLRGDGGGKVPALARSVVGRDRVAHTLLAWARMGVRFGGSIRPVTVNGGPGAVISDRDGRPVGVWALEFGDRGIVGIASIVNPDKLRHLGEVGSIAEALRSVRG